MQLKKVELVGFKSFADRSEFTFDGGITAVIGPNGCGKSNLVDAVRWALGEQSAKSLRAGSMGDCIFAGTATRKPLGFAEVTVTFDNSSGKLRIEYDEVAVTRRVYGSGEGGYFINRKPCRLRDIRELFMGTGIGTTAYSIIEQGEIGRIISSDPKELRAVFDEAAGISLYKARLKTAAVKLERVTQNLLRVGDIVAEVEKRLRSVKYQAAKARRFREISARLRELKLQRSRRDYTALSARRDELSGAVARRRQETASLESALNALESGNDTARSELLEIEEHIETSSAELARLDKEVSDSQFAIELARTHISHHDENRKRLLAAVDTGRSEVAAAEARAVALENRNSTIEKRAENLSRAAADLAAAQRTLAENTRALAEKIASAETTAVEALRAAASLNNRLSEISAAERASLQQKKRLADRRGELQGLSATFHQRRQDLQHHAQTLAADANTLDDRLAAIRNRKNSLITAIRHDVDKALSESSEQLAAVASRRNLLADLQRRREGVSVAARAVLDMNLPDTLGLVADLIEVPPHLTLPVENLLGETAGALVVTSNNAAMQVAAILKNGQEGRAKILSLERAAGTPKARAQAAPGLLPIAADVAGRPDCAPLVTALLGDCLIAESLESAIAANGSASRFRVATPEGDVLDTDGGLSAGAATDAGGLIWRRTEIDRLSHQETEIRTTMAAIEDRRREILDNLAQLDEHETEMKNDLAKNAARTAELQASLQAVDSRLAEFAREIEVTDSEAASIQNELGAFQAERAAVKTKIDQVRLEAERTESHTAQLKDARTAALSQLEAAGSRYTRMKVILASVLEKQSASRRQYAQARLALETTAAALQQATADVAAADDLVAAEKHRIQEAAERLQSARRRSNAARVVLAARSRRGRALREEAARFAPALKSAREKLEKARSALSELSIEEREVQVRLSDLVARARDELSVSPQELAEPCEKIEDEQALDTQVADLARKLSSMGGVNMEALAELDELTERHAFLVSQRDDLAAAGESLEKVIAKTRATSRKMFLESFQSVKDHFGNIFRRIFGGGRADCILVDPSDPLESRIEIMAKPPGKELSRLTLLSGGEKAMTAVALLFAMFSNRPSPFLILDEVDAPMDESNIGRFLDLMRDFLPACQFVIITHSRRTMASADTLYGITMEEQGVSKKVSLSFRNEPEPLESVAL